MRDHGGNLDWAMGRWGGSDWIDLSTGINRLPYPVGAITSEAWTALPTRTAVQGLLTAARERYATHAPIVALAGAQAAIQMIPRLVAPGLARVLGPTYNEHVACLRMAGWQVEEVTHWTGLRGADLAVLVNPNNPDGTTTKRCESLNLLSDVGRLVVDESFVDATPTSSLAPDSDRSGLIILRSFGKFYGLAGLRLGFAIGNAEDIATVTEMAGPWPVAGPAIEIGTQALRDHVWAAQTVARLTQDAGRLTAIAADAGWLDRGGTVLFRLFAVDDAAEAQDRLARHRIWSRVFPYSNSLIRLGLPGTAEEFSRLGDALHRKR